MKHKHKWIPVKTKESTQEYRAGLVEKITEIEAMICSDCLEYTDIK
jgi:hypothetical protein